MLALKVMGLMCDGQYRLMQNYLREQRDNIHTIDLVGGVASFLQHFYHDINEETVELVHLILQTLIEMCVGNYSNQKVIFNHQILEALNSIFQIDITGRHEEYGEKVSRPLLCMYTHNIIYTHTHTTHKLAPYTNTNTHHLYIHILTLCSHSQSVDLKASAVELLEVMLEETDKKSAGLVKEIADDLNILALHDTLADFYVLMKDPDVKQKGFDDEAERGLFRTYHVLVHLMDYNIPTTIKEQISKCGVLGL